MARALVICQGINSKQGYLCDNIAQFPQFKEYYQRIIDITTEKYFDAHKPWFLKLFGKTGDILSDIWEYYTNNAARLEVCRETRNQIQNLCTLGYEVDIIAHSLGTVITLCCGPNTSANPVKVRRTILMQSPLGVGNLIARMKTNSHTERYSNNFSTKEMYYTWSEQDYISCKFTGRICDIISARVETSPIILSSGLGHSGFDNLAYLLNSKNLLGPKWDTIEGAG